MKRVAVALTVLVLAASIAPTTAGAASGQSAGRAYAGTHVSFDADAHAVTDYAIGGETMLDSVKVQSQSAVESGGLADLGGSLSAVTSIDGAGLHLGAQTTTEARVSADGGANITAHDDGHGVLVVSSGNQSNYVVADLPAEANATAESDSQVSVTTANGTEGTFLVVGEGNATVNDDGGVTARLGEDARLVFRAYPHGRTSADEKQERLIADGTARGEVYVMPANGTDGSANASGAVVDTVSYDSNTTVETAASADGAVAFTVDRTTHEGTVVLTSVSEAALNASEGLTVTVDGDAAVEAATYTQLESAVGSDRSRYLVRESGSADASADVLVAINHFSDRTVSMRSEQAETTTADGSGNATTMDETKTTAADGGTATTAADGGTTATTTAADGASGGDGSGTTVADRNSDNGGGVPGFTPATAVVALLAAALLARRR